jgi:hypothetical protein
MRRSVGGAAQSALYSRASKHFSERDNAVCGLGVLALFRRMAKDRIGCVCVKNTICVMPGADVNAQNANLLLLP